MADLIDELEREKSYADNMAAMAQLWMEKAQAAERTLAILVYAAGGEIRVYQDHLRDAPDLELVRETRPEDMSARFRARRRAKASQPAPGS